MSLELEKLIIVAKATVATVREGDYTTGKMFNLTWSQEEMQSAFDMIFEGVPRDIISLKLNRREEEVDILVLDFLAQRTAVFH